MNVHLFHPRGPDRVAMISAREVWASPGRFTLVVSRGRRRGALLVGPTIGPVSAPELEAQTAALVAQLAREGFVPAGRTSILEALADPREAVRARAALRAGWRRDRGCVDAILAAAARGTTELPTLVEALGRIGDPRALPLVRAEAERKLLSRRRAGAEAARLLGDASTLAEVAARARERLPEAVRAALDAGDAAALEGSFKSLEARDLGLALDALYDHGSLLAVTVTRAILRRVMIHPPHFWRYAKSLFKRAMLREDGETFAILVRRIELAARSHRGTQALVKSGLDGQQRRTRIFSLATQRFVMRLGWRWLRRLAEHRPEAYAPIAAEVLAIWEPGDREVPSRGRDAWSRAYVLNRIWRGQHPHGECAPRTLRYRPRPGATKVGIPENARFESFPECWDAKPEAYLTVLAKAKVVEVHAFASKALRARHIDVLQAAPHATVLAMLGAPSDETVALALGEIERRFDPRRPDASLLDAMVADGREAVRERALRFLVLCADRWTRDVDRIMVLLASPEAAVRTTVAGLVAASLDAADGWFRRELAERILGVLQQPEAFEGAHDAPARLAREGLARELGAVLSLDEVLALVARASAGAQSLGGELLGMRPEAATALGTDRLMAMAMHDIAAVRFAAQRLLRTCLDALRSDPSALFSLAGSAWDDTRAFAFGLLRDELDVGSLGVDGIVALCDAIHPEVQAFGREMALRHFDRVDPQDLIGRLAQHPAAPMRRFALDLVAGHLREGFVPLAKLEGFFRRALLDVRPSRAERRRVVEFLLARGLRDERQAEVSARLLGELARTRVRVDVDAALDALVQLKLAHPEVDSVLSLEAAP